MLIVILFGSLSFFAFSSMESDGLSGGYYILTVTSEDKVPSMLILLHEGFLFLIMREKIYAPQQL